MSEAEAYSKPKHNRNKRKKSFLKNARKYAKMGHYGCGKRLEEDTYNYLVKSMEIFREGFPSEEEKQIFVENVFKQLKNEELNCASNQVGCRVIETLFPYASDEIILQYAQVLGVDLRPICADRFVSHVIEALLAETTKRHLQTENDEFKTFTIKISRFLLNNIEDYMWDTYANHILRSVLCNLAQINKDESKDNDLSKAKTENKEETEKKINNDCTNIPVDFMEIINDYGERLINWPQFNELPSTELSSGFLQVLLRALIKVNEGLCRKYFNRLLKESFVEKEEKSNKLADVFFSKPRMMVLEIVIQIAPKDIYNEIYEGCFQNNVLKLATMRNSNFAVQKLFLHCHGKTEYETMFSEIEEHFSEIFEAGHPGVILAAAQACKRLTGKQGSFIQNILKAFNCLESTERQDKIAICLSKMITFEELPKELGNLENEKLNLHGTLILQNILGFNKPIKIINSLLSLEKNDLKGLFSNSMGSHIANAFVDGQFVGEKSKEKLIRRMQGNYQDLASTKFGSRSFEAIWKVCNDKFKEKIMEELAYKEGAWSNTLFGKIIASKINLAMYKRKKEDWKQFINSNKESKPKNLLEDILGTNK